MNKLAGYLKRAAPTILSVLTAGSVLATAVLSSKAALKAERLLAEAAEKKGEKLSKTETIRTAAPVYIPTVTVGVAAIALVFGANTLNKRQQIALAGAYTLARDRFVKYRDKVKDIYGEEVHRRIVDELAVEQCRETSIEAPGLASNSCLDFHGDEELYIFHDSFSDRNFESTFSRVLQAEYHLNRNFTLGGSVSLNDYFDFLGLARTDYGDVVGWSMATGYSWIDFHHRRMNLDDGTPCFVIEVQFEPEEGFADW